MPVLRVKTKGGTYYRGDIYVDLDSLHVKRVQAMVMDITKTTMYGIPVQVGPLTPWMSHIVARQSQWVFRIPSIPFQIWKLDNNAQ